MPNKKNTRAANGAGTIGKKTVMRNGEPYTYWEARITVGRDPGTGKQMRKSFTGKTQKEVREKMQAAAVELSEGTYKQPSKLTVSEWLDIWSEEYLNSVKPRTVEAYKKNIRVHIVPALGAIKLSALSPIDIQRFYNTLPCKPLSPKSIKNIHGTLHKALEKAVLLGFIKFNPADRPDLPKVEHADIKPLDEEQIKQFLSAVKGHRYETVYLVALFTGMRESEIIGLSWDCVSFESGTVLIKQQLQRYDGTNGEYILATTKNSRWRTIRPAEYVMKLLKYQQIEQYKQRLAAGSNWDNKLNLVFTDELGRCLKKATVYNNFKRIVTTIGIPEARFHDLRHSYAVAAIRAGDDIKTVQSNLGHHSAAFTLDVYGHVTEEMKQDSAVRMNAFIDGLQERKNA